MSTIRSNGTTTILVSLLALGAGFAQAAPADAKKDAAGFTDEQKQDIARLTDEFAKAETRAARFAPLRKIVAMGPEAAAMACRAVDEALARQEKVYFDLLNKHVRAAYLKRLCAFRDDHIRKVQFMRRLWKDYLEHTSNQHAFQDNFLKPVWAVTDYMMIKPSQMREPEIVKQRKLLFELADYRVACRKAAGIPNDPTAGKKSPTGIDIPHLDQPPTVGDYLSLLDRLMVLAGSFAPQETAKQTLFKNIDLFRSVDVQESEFVMYCETVRMLVGSRAWFGHELICAATRDHSADRKAGLASGHMSTIPEKRGFTMRIKRMGAPFCGSEGAGGGRSGPGYAYGLSYGGGHTHPLYSIKRNMTGVGRRGGVYTSCYGTQKNLFHPCPVTEKELFMPPGLTRADLETPDLLAVYDLLQAEKYADAHAKIEELKLKDEYDKMVLRFFSGWIRAELDWYFECAGAIGKAGDMYEVKLRHDDAKRKFTGIRAFDAKAAVLDKLLESKKMESELEAGKAYRPIARGIVRQIRDRKLDEDAARKQLDAFARQYPKTTYAEAALWRPGEAQTDGKIPVNPIGYFLDKNPNLPKYQYYTYGLEVLDTWPPR